MESSAITKARDESECGLPEAGWGVDCTPSTCDPAGGNTFYSHDENGEDETSGDFTIRLGGELSIDCDPERPGDDVYIFPDDAQDHFYVAVWIAPDEVADYAGDTSLYSSANATSNGYGILAWHYAKSGALRMEVSDGNTAPRARLQVRPPAITTQASTARLASSSAASPSIPRAKTPAASSRGTEARAA